MRGAGHVARIGERRGIHRVLVRKTEGKRTLGRPKRRLEDNIKMELQEVGRGARTGFIRLRRAVAGSCECGNEPSGSIKCGENS